MVDPAALREALDALDSALPSDADSYAFAVALRMATDAARELLTRIEGGQKVWWCEEHECTGESSDYCNMEALEALAMRGLPGSSSCRMVEAELHIPAQIETLDRNSRGIW